MDTEIASEGTSPLFTHVEGIFYRAIDPRYRAHVLAGSRMPGRYSRTDQPTLYLGSSLEGVKTAMASHRSNRSSTLEIVRLHVVADRIFDLRNSTTLALADINVQDAIAPWQEIVAEGGSPSSWRVREQLETCGAKGLIDPSRNAPGRWHLVLFSWNSDHSPRVSLMD